MMVNIYGVCNTKAFPHKGYSDFVQHTGPIISGQSYQAAYLQSVQTLFIDAAYVQKEKGRTVNTTLWVNADGDQSFSCLDFLRCLRLISPCMAVTMNCPVVSPSSFTDSIASTTSCGARACTFCDFALTAFVATDEISLVWWRTVYTKNKPVKCLTCLHLENKVEDTLIHLRCENSEAQKDGNPIWASNHNVIGANTMACQHSTQTRPKFVCIFLVIAKEFPASHPDALRVEADAEDDFRAKLIGFTPSCSAKLRTETSCHRQIFSIDEGFMWAYEQRQSATEVRHA